MIKSLDFYTIYYTEGGFHSQEVVLSHKEPTQDEARKYILDHVGEVPDDGSVIVKLSRFREFTTGMDTETHKDIIKVEASMEV